MQISRNLFGAAAATCNFSSTITHILHIFDPWCCVHWREDCTVPEWMKPTRAWEIRRRNYNILTAPSLLLALVHYVQNVYQQSHCLISATSVSFRKKRTVGKQTPCHSLIWCFPQTALMNWCFLKNLQSRMGSFGHWQTSDITKIWGCCDVFLNAWQNYNIFGLIWCDHIARMNCDMWIHFCGYREHTPLKSTLKLLSSEVITVWTERKSIYGGGILAVLEILNTHRRFP